MRARHPRRFPKATVQLFKGVIPLAGCLDSVTPLAQRLKVVEVVGASWPGHDVVYKGGRLDAASFGTVAA